jgi:dTDP-4-dehydrorhamnose reductase
VVSRYEFACEAARVFDLPVELIEPVSTKGLAQIAPRPLNLGLMVNKASNYLPFPLLGYKAGLLEMKKNELELRSKGNLWN